MFQKTRLLVIETKDVETTILETVHLCGKAGDVYVCKYGDKQIEISVMSNQVLV